jgi:hypothetical protein
VRLLLLLAGLIQPLVRLEQNCFKNNLGLSRIQAEGPQGPKSNNPVCGISLKRQTPVALRLPFQLPERTSNSFAKTSLHRGMPGLLALRRVQRLTGPVRPMAHVSLLTVVCETHFDYCVVDE